MHDLRLMAAIEAIFPEVGKYRILLRRAATVNTIEASAAGRGYRRELALGEAPNASSPSLTSARYFHPAASLWA